MAVMLLEWVFTSTFLILVVLALRAALGKRMSAGLRYALWAVVLVRLLVPVQLFTSPVAGTWVLTENRTEKTVYTPADPSVIQGEKDGALSLGGQSGPSTAQAAFPQAPSAPNLPDAPEPPDLNNLPGWTAYLGWAWLAGSAMAAAVLLLSNLRFYGKLRRERIPLDEADHPLRVYVAVGLPSPCLFGLVRPAIYVTPEAAADPTVLRHVLAHEYTHYRHGDHLWSLLRCAALAVHWWNPLVWVSAVLSQRDGELACDEGALKRLGDGERAAYGGTLLALVTAKPRPGDLFRCATTMAGDKKRLKERITRIAQKPQRVLWAVVVAVVVTAMACLCAFGQAEPAEESGPAPSEDPAASAQPSGEPAAYDEQEWLMGHFAADNLRDVPEEVLTAIGTGIREGYERFLEAKSEYYSWLGEDEIAGFDDWRVENLEGPFEHTIRGVKAEIWRVNYEYHTDEPDKAENMLVGGMYVTEDGWFCPTYSNCTYYTFLLDEQGNRRLAAVMMSNDCAPGTSRFCSAVEQALAMELGKMPMQADLNRNGVPETLKVAELDEGMGQRLEVWEDGKLLYSEDGYFAHAGYNALFLYSDSDGDCLLRYNPYMGQGWCTYSWKLFTLSETGEEQVKQENSVDFDINFGLRHESFDVNEICGFMDEVNRLLSRSIQLLNTDVDLLATFEKNGQLYDDLGWLDDWAPTYVRGGRTLPDELWAFQSAMEAEWGGPWGLYLTASDVTRTGLTLEFMQTGGHPTGELSYGSKYWLERWDDDLGEWGQVVGKNVGWFDVAYPIPMAGQTAEQVDWSYVYGEVLPGRYRIGKEIMDFRKSGDYDIQNYYAEFDVE